MKKYIKAIILTLTVMLFFSVGTRASAADADSKAARVVTESTALNIRAEPSASSKKLATAKKGKYLTLIEKENNWWRVEYAYGKYGYCHEDYLKAVSASKAVYVATNSGSLNVRSGKGTSYKIKATLPKDTVVVLIKNYGEWSRILYNGNKTGYVKADFLKDAQNMKYRKISLEVPSYKQNDSRWSSIKIGTQGDTLGSSGCTTTALAMTESYRLGKTVTPKDMVSRLSYAPSGILYWPGSYNVSLASSDYLSELYSLLSQGKPVVFGMKTRSGSQHWVVVTGYNKSSTTLSAASFTINDPGSNTRVLLNEVMSKYPVPYKIAVAR